jgi:hypothetical protein
MRRENTLPPHRSNSMGMLSDPGGNTNFGTPANPLATNQVVGTPVYATNTSAAGASINASLPAVAGKTTYLNGFYASVDTAATTKQVFVTVSFDGGTTAHMNFLLASSASVPGVVDMVFPDPIPATGPNKTIVVTIPSVGGTSSVSLSVFGYQL